MENIKTFEQFINESSPRHCVIYKVKSGRWYLELADFEGGEEEDATTYGSFGSEDAADRYLSRMFSNPGDTWIDHKGDREVPKKSPNGKPVVRV